MELGLQLFCDLGCQFCQVGLLAGDEVGGLFGLRDEGHVTDKVGQPQGLGMGFFDECLLAAVGESGAADECLEVSAYAAYGCAQLVGDVVAHLLLQKACLFGACHVGKCHFERAVGVDEELEGDVTAACGYGVAEHRGLGREVALAAVEAEKFCSGGEDGLLPDGAYVCCRAVEYGVGVLHEARIGVHLSPFGGENGDAFLEMVEVAHETLALGGDEAGGFFLLFVFRHDGPAYVSQL